MSILCDFPLQIMALFDIDIVFPRYLWSWQVQERQFLLPCKKKVVLKYRRCKNEIYRHSKPRHLHLTA